jgi:hypothetical protein
MLPVQDAAESAIASAHSNYVIHRDIQQANFMLGPFGETLVVDCANLRTSRTL